MKTYNKNIKLYLSGYDNIKLQSVHSYKEIHMQWCKHTYLLYMRMLTLFNEFRNVANEEKFTMLGGKLFQTFTT